MHLSFQITVVDCGNIPLTSEMITFYNSTIFGSDVRYVCPSGYTRINGMNTVVYTCESSGQWNSTDMEDLLCPRRFKTYYGCFDVSLFQATNQSFDMVFDCVNYCRNNDFSFGGMMIDKCYCKDDIALKMELNNSICDTPCSSGRFICGGQGVVSTHVTYAGCYRFAEAITLEFKADGNVLQLTCVETCRGIRKKLAIYINGRCSCKDGFNYPVATWNGCATATFNDTITTVDSAFIMTVAKTGPIYRDCDALYQAGIRRHGIYILQDGTNVSCHFKDGTICPTSWLGNGGNCYYFDITKRSPGAALQNCLEQNSFLLSIESKDENDFISEALNTFSDFEENEWLMGHYGIGVQYRMFSDGSLTLYHNHDPKISTLDRNCTVLRKKSDGEVAWTPRDCGDLHKNSICKKAEEYLGVYAIPNKTAELINVDMGIMLCVETCRVRNTSLALISQLKCWCDDILPPTTDKTGREYCYLKGQPCGSEFTADVYSVDVYPSLALSCNDLFNQGIFLSGLYMINGTSTNCQFIDNDSGDEYEDWVYVHGKNFRLIHSKVKPSQYDDTCKLYGGVPATLSTLDQYHTMLQLIKLDKLLAKSCEELEFNGVKGGTFKLIYPDGTTRKQFCNDSSCPPSWITVNDHCYKFISADDTGVNSCPRMVAYDAVVDSDAEIEDISSAIENIDFLKTTQKNWKIGLFDFADNGFYRWFNGRYVEERYSALEYLGVYAIPNKTAELINVDMGIMLCVETCRVRNTSLALISQLKCWCDDILPPTTDKTGREYCYLKGQPCGSEFTADVYSVDVYPSLALSCNDLFNQGIFLSGLYMINGTSTNCQFIDNDSGDEYEDWVYVHGKNFRLIHSKVKPSQYDDTCKLYGGVPATLSTLDQYHTMLQLIKLSKLGLNKLILVGLRDQFARGQFSWADGSLFRQLPWLFSVSNTKSTYAAIDINNGYLTNSISDNTKYAMLCMKEKDYIGCFGEEESVLDSYIVLSNYKSMTVSQCQQLCYKKDVLGDVYILVNVNNCYCIYDVTVINEQLTSVNSTFCDIPCPGNDLQKCGFLGYVRAYISDRVKAASTCLELHANGVMVKNEYTMHLQNGTLIQEQCSFSENSTGCDIGWIRFNNTCFWPEPQSKSHQKEASKICVSKNGYLATVRDSDDIAFFRTLIETTPPWENLTLWHTGISDALINGKYVLPNGLHYNTDGFAWLDSKTVTKNCGALDTSSGYLEWIDCEERLPFICQKDEYVRCELNQQLATYVTGIDSNFNIQQCVEICRTINNTVRIGLRDETCNCYNQAVYFNDRRGVCDKSCQVYSNQPCGPKMSDSETVIELGLYTSSSKNCNE
ncbi:hypothetical protein LOTGIDRAFT_228874 [Lottia gigantea]|uniref:C-type lectin domain-containing protein n=1 Tax=Lottia gigantea TaxID=225164 RepID=V4BRK3_LOTGI|nr:hypothetical protein LOTGIDRAFT_228874 [Lottia gigantea]ESO91519.1 hypothetical protein LOTGIDRAFT_228874 [Lottia gigantea]